MAFNYNDYKELKCIESTGTQYINTGVSCGNMSGKKVEVKISSAQYYGDNYAFMMMERSGRRWINISPTSLTTYKLQMGGSGSEKSFTVDSVTNYHTIILDFANSYGQVDDNQQSLSSTTETIYNNIPLFAFNDGTNYHAKAKAKLEYAKIYENDVLIREFIPAMNKQSQIVGLFDTVNETFYTNQGSGVFLYEELPVSDTLYVNDNGVWKKGTPYVYDNGVWKKGTPYVYDNGVWKKSV